MQQSKYTFLLLFGLFLLASCQPDLSPLEQAKADLKEKKAELSEISVEVDRLSKEIEKLDPVSKKKEKALLITTKEVEKKTYLETIEVQGTITTKGNFLVAPEMGGTIIELTVSEGDYIKKGQLVARLDDSQITSAIAEIETGLTLARDVFARRTRLWEQGIGAEIEYLKAKNDVESLEKKMESIQVNQDKSNVYAPASGVVEMVNSKQGELASPGRPIVTVVDMSRVQIVAEIAENYLKSVNKGEKIAVFIPALNLKTTARITKISSILNPANRTFTIEADIANKGGKLKPNLISIITIKEFEKEDAIVIPTNLIREDLKGDYVYTVAMQNNEPRAKKVAIQKTRSSSGETLIDAGLLGGEKIIAEGRSAVADGDLVKIQR